MGLSIAERKARLRECLQGRRRALSRQQRQEADQAIHARLLELPEVERAGVVFCYVSAGAEVNTRPVIDALRARGKTVVIPVPAGGAGNEMIAARFDGWETLIPGQLGILTPRAPVAWRGDIDLCVTPGLGFTPDGKRLGLGKGYYDAWFAAHPGVIKSALCYECQLVAAMPTTAQDVLMDKIITEKRVIPAAAGAAD